MCAQTGEKGSRKRKFGAVMKFTREMQSSPGSYVHPHERMAKVNFELANE